MASFGSGGGSSSGGSSANRPQIAGLGLDQITQQFGQQLAQQMQSPQSVKPGQMASLSPQQRLAMVMRQYGGG